MDNSQETPGEDGRALTEDNPKVTAGITADITQRLNGENPVNQPPAQPFQQPQPPVQPPSQQMPQPQAGAPMPPNGQQPPAWGPQHRPVQSGYVPAAPQPQPPVDPQASSYFQVPPQGWNNPQFQQPMPPQWIGQPPHTQHSGSWGWQQPGYGNQYYAPQPFGQPPMQQQFSPQQMQQEQDMQVPPRSHYGWRETLGLNKVHSSTPWMARPVAGIISLVCVVVIFVLSDVSTTVAHSAGFAALLFLIAACCNITSIALCHNTAQRIKSRPYIPYLIPKMRLFVAALALNCLDIAMMVSHAG